MKSVPAKKGSSSAEEDRPQKAVFWLALSLLILVPLVFDTRLHRIYVIPKLSVLLIGASLLIPLIILGMLRASSQWAGSAALFKSKHVLIVGLYSLVAVSSTILSRDPTASLFGHFYNQMGLISRLCFFVCFIALIKGIGLNHTRFKTALWAMFFAGLLVSVYAVCQFFGYDPFLPSVLYTSDYPEGAVVRVIGTLGHADYLGNFLLYTTPLAASLAIASRGPARLLAMFATALSITAIVCSGTRGAWFGIACGTVIFAALNLRDLKYNPARPNRRQLVKAALMGFLFILVVSVFMSLSPASRSIVQRARLSFKEGFTGSGRTGLWRDSIKMVPAFALTGTGPDNFRKAFLPYKSRELGRVTSVNSESSHNSYLDASIFFGLPGLLLYVAIILSAFRLLLRSRRHTINDHMRLIIAGIISSLLAVTVHNFFIFDQIPTGLYFFAFIALAQVVSNITDSEAANATVHPKETDAAGRVLDGRTAKSKLRRLFAGNTGWIVWLSAATACLLAVLAVWYSTDLVKADAAINKSMMSADAGDLNDAISYGERAAGSREVTGEYNFLFARALVLCADRLDTRSSAAGSRREALTIARDQALELADASAQKSLAHSQTPDLNYMFLAYLALLKGDVQKLRGYAGEAVSWDPNHFRTRWMLSEAHLASGDRYRAAKEAEIALDLNPTFGEAQSVIERARGETESPEARIEGIIARANQKAEAQDFEQALHVLGHAFRLSNGRCPKCHRALALIYERGKQYQNAIAEWQIFLREAPDRASEERIASRIEELKQKQ